LTLYQNPLKHDIELVKCYEESLPQLACYPDDLNQVWTNLIHNALQAMHYHGTLTIRIYRRGNFLCVTIQDNGDGISVEDMHKIFDPFFTTKAVGEGSGLGLHIIKQIVEKHQGTIEVDSVPGCTQFTVVLPLITVEEPLALTHQNNLQ
jgi:two-component system NtrC family sensor kinase